MRTFLLLILEAIGAILLFALALVVAGGIACAIVALDAWLLTVLWPLTVPIMFPGLVKTGILTATVDFWPAFWFLAMLWVIRPMSWNHLGKREKNDE
jgi:hypothetical protein